ncbi:hypothetical protein [Nocardia cyriacigeorgica]|uniref:hypothetical protein n=1 Tax=Nocardia cyriacigeorgica TaxID=135487 RepID=UPI0018945F81|nr:hypothetical protein [Nocardia cyriacigeorgica]MBF6162985.1 hypothetical protein [Nocardia cyriacigeorgica]MBF6201964.1 hypothetical protein [Nocardia cyriacigeorgica]
MAEHEIKFEATTVGDKAADAKVRQLLEDPNVYGVSRRSRGDGDVVKYQTRD